MLVTFLLVSLFNNADPIPVKNFKALLGFRADRIAKYPVSEEVTSLNKQIAGHYKRHEPSSKP